MRIENPFHQGERDIQAITGEQQAAERNGKAIGDAIMPGALKLVGQQSMLVFGSIAPGAGVWASLLTGPPGFATAPDQKTVQLNLRDAGSHPNDALWRNIQHDNRLGLLAIDLATRRRLRINGRIQRSSPKLIEIHVDEAFPNCPKFIQRRIVTVSPGANAPDEATNNSVIEGRSLDDAQQELIASADTLFVASAHPDRGADVSHRGGEPGFVKLIDASTLRIPDYAGNSMFNTLGNLQVNPHAGLLFIDFARSRTLQLTGTATIRLNSNEDPAQPTGGTRRYWDFAVDRWIEAPMSFPLHVEFVDAWKDNPEHAGSES